MCELGFYQARPVPFCVWVFNRTVHVQCTVHVMTFTRLHNIYLYFYCVLSSYLPITEDLFVRVVEHVHVPSALHLYIFMRYIPYLCIW